MAELTLKDVYETLKAQVGTEYTDKDYWDRVFVGRRLPPGPFVASNTEA